MNISLDKNDFEKLISGEIITKERPVGLDGHTVNVNISLQDIGYDLMIELITKKWDELANGRI